MKAVMLRPLVRSAGDGPYAACVETTLARVPRVTVTRWAAPPEVID